MTRRCTVCDHPRREAIDAALVEATTAKRRIAAHHGLEDSSLRRHEARHVPALLSEAAEARRLITADSLLEQVRRRLERSEDIVQRAEALFAEVEGGDDVEVAIKALDQFRKANADLDAGLTLLGKVRGELVERHVVNITALVAHLPALPSADRAALRDALGAGRVVDAAAVALERGTARVVALLDAGDVAGARRALVELPADVLDGMAGGDGRHSVAGVLPLAAGGEGGEGGTGKGGDENGD